LIQDIAREGAFNMAADLFLARRAEATGRVILRLYAWERPTLSLGYHQKFTPQQLENCRREGVDVVRRPSGGRAVLHDHELTYALALPSAHPWLRQGRDALLRQVGAAFVEAAKNLDLPAELVRAGNREADSVKPLSQGNPLCFSSVSRWEVRLAGHKWIGSAQRILPGSFLQHGAILLGPNRINLAALLGLPEPDQENIIPFIVEAEALRRHIPEAFRLHLATEWREEPFTHQELSQIRRFIEEESAAAD
jgi:lipoate-protein ligase A